MKKSQVKQEQALKDAEHVQQQKDIEHAQAQRKEALLQRESLLRTAEENFEQMKEREQTSMQAGFDKKQADIEVQFQSREQSLIAREQSVQEAESRTAEVAQALKDLYPSSTTSTFTPLPFFDTLALRHGSLVPYTLPVITGESFRAFETAVQDALASVGMSDTSHASSLTDILAFSAEIHLHQELPSGVISTLAAWKSEVLGLCTNKELWTSAGHVRVLYNAMQVFDRIYKRHKAINLAHDYFAQGRPGMTREMFGGYVASLRGLRDMLPRDSAIYAEMEDCCVQENRRVGSIFREGGGVGWLEDEVKVLEKEQVFGKELVLEKKQMVDGGTNEFKQESRQEQGVYDEGISMEIEDEEW